MKRFLLFLPVALLLWLAFTGGKTLAAPNPVPPPGRIPCEQDQTEDPNFNSSRPYQASPCGDSPKAVMCGNKLQVIEETPTRTAPAGTQSLDVNITMERRTYSATLTGAEFPIAGNTEQTVNSQNPTDQIDDAVQVNEYLNWYLGGVNNRAEQGANKNTEDYVVNFSGPVQKLLPEAFQNAQRITSIYNLVTSVTYTDDGSGAQPTITDDAITHNQIVVCIEGGNPIPCYDGNGSPSNGRAYRLNDWYDGSLSPLTTFFNWVGTNVWNNRYPPLPWQFTKSVLYEKAYNEWKGNTCVILPFTEFLVCGRVPGVSNSPFWAENFKFIPLSNTVDKKAKNMITGVGINGQNGTELVLPAIAYEVVHEPILYFPHTAETSELSDALNKTYIPKEGTTSAPPPLTTEPVNDPVTGQCRILDVRTNKGDYLFPEIPPDINEVNVDVKEYTVTKIPCRDVTRTITDPLTGLQTEVTQARCQGQITIEIRMVTKVPYATEIYNSTTAGADSTFRKIFPKVMEGAPVSCVSNLPSVTDVQYIPKENMDGLKVIDPLNRNTTDDSKLYFPHFGSVYDLFLKGIQTALRPQGFGDPIIDGRFCANTVATGLCKQWLFEKDPSGKFYYDKIIEVAASTTCNGKSLNPAWALGIALNENGGLMSDKVDGSSNTHFGCNIPQVQSIEDKISCMANTLRNDCLAGKSDAQALIEYGYPAGYQVWPVTVLSPGSYPPPIFGSGFSVSSILASLLSTNWFDAYKSVAPTFCPGSPVLTPPTP